VNLSGNKIVITGGASGIGLGLAERFIAENNTVIVCGRRQSVLDEVSKKFPAMIVKHCDLSTAGGREGFFHWIEKEHGDVSVLINNAGIQQWMSVTEIDFFPRSQNEIAVNIEAPLHLTSLFLKLHSLRTIMNVTSGLAFVPLIKVPVYCATKAFFHSFTLSLRELVKPNNIDVIEIIPPALNTDLGGKGVHDHAQPVGDFINAVFEQLHQGKTELMFGFSEAVTKAGPEELRHIFTRMNTKQ
jgi:uncharacterized oxidoreductase